MADKKPLYLWGHKPYHNVRRSLLFCQIAMHLLATASALAYNNFIMDNITASLLKYVERRHVNVVTVVGQNDR